MTNEIEEMKDIINFCCQEMDNFSFLEKIKLMQGFLMFTECVKPIYEKHKNKREDKVIKLFKDDSELAESVSKILSAYQEKNDK